MLTKVKMCTSVTVHNSNVYYSSVMAMMTILCPRQGRDEPMGSYYRGFEASILTAEMEKRNATTHVELNKDYVDGDNGYGTKRFQEMCLIMSSDSGLYSGIWKDLNNSTLIGTDNYTKTTTATYNVLCH